MNNSSTNSTNDRLKMNSTVDSDQFYGLLFEYNPDMVLFMDVYGVIAKVNKRFSETLGYEEKEVELSTLEQFMPLSEGSNYKIVFQKALIGETQHTSTKLVKKNGKNIYISLNLIPSISEGRVIGVFGIAKDITDKRKSEKELADSELKFSSIVEEALVGVFIVKEDGRVLFGNKKFYDMLGIDNSETEVNLREHVDPEVLDTIIKLPIHGEKGQTHHFRITRKDGTVLELESHLKKVKLQNNAHIVGTLQDVTETKKTAALNEYLAYHDYLTGLPNKRLLYKKLEQELIIGKTLEQPLTVMMLDLDRFKYINDSLGHPIGDKLVIKVSERLKRLLQNDGIVGRDGGDEFMILLPNIGNVNQIVPYAKKIIRSLEEPFYIEDYELLITASIGISTFPQHGEDVETLMKHADSALYKAKEKGKNTYQIFTASMNTETYKLFELESDLRKALELNQLELHYQPIVDAVTYQIIGAEALIRWNHPEWGVVSPNEFIPLAEETGMIVEIGKWVKAKAIRQNKTWQDIGLPAIPISTNLSAHRFLEKDLLDNIQNILDETKLNPEYIQLEVLETSLLENEEVVFSILDELKKIGIKIILDDFGTGYSSLSYLKRFKGRIDGLKIDRSFINDLSQTHGENSNFITKTIIELAHHLNIDILAEGVETVEQLELLKEYKCNQVQGFLFSKPVTAEAFAVLLEKGKIEPPSDANKNMVTEQRREFFRINLEIPLIASMTLTEINGRKLNLGKTKVLIEDIGLGGLRFLSNITLPAHRGIILEFETEILGKIIQMYGKVVWTDEWKAGINQYGLEFIIDESERTDLAKIFNKLAILLRKSPIVPDCSFLKENRFTFFKQKDEKEKDSLI